ncbi:isoprenylcysteine carboxylmethyltransferase family protein [Desulfobacterales bacterium HSG16]|nr:isoprenylcysteine carboxylmethyltransferase family protein [Desulfobacterales bacterium HSG16]
MKAIKYRIFLSRIATAICFLFICSTQSCWAAKNEMISIVLFFTGIILIGIASLGRMWCSLYIAGYKDDILVIKGPYSICRNPLYFFSMIGIIGIGCVTRTFTVPIVFTVLFAFYYPFVIKGEERRLKHHFGVEFEKYAERVPAFFPKIAIFDEPENYNVKPAVYRRHIFSAVWFIWIVGILEIIEGIKTSGLFISLWSIY